VRFLFARRPPSNKYFCSTSLVNFSAGINAAALFAFASPAVIIIIIKNAECTPREIKIFAAKQKRGFEMSLRAASAAPLRQVLRF